MRQRSVGRPNSNCRYIFNVCAKYVFGIQMHICRIERFIYALTRLNECATMEICAICENNALFLGQYFSVGRTSVAKQKAENQIKIGKEKQQT